MSERPRPAGKADPPPSLVSTDAPVLSARTGLDVAGTVAGPTGSALLTVTLRAEPPEDGAVEALLVVVAAGEVDLDTAPLLQAALADAVVRHAVVCCDLSDVAFFSGVGVAALLAAYEQAAENGSRLTVRGAHGITRRVLELCGVDQLLGGHEQERNGVSRVDSGPPGQPEKGDG